VRVILNKTVEVVTPCLCAGARQEVAEIRAPSIRGALRWWFRALGGSKSSEAEIFGSAAGDEGSASRVVVRVSMLPSGGKERMHLTSNQNFFTSGNRKGVESRIPAGAKFSISMLERQPVSSEIFSFSVECFLRLGSIGLRANRGCGALQDVEWKPDEEKFNQWAAKLKSHNFDIYTLESQNGYLPALTLIEEKIKEFRSVKRIDKNSEDSLGFTIGKDGRQSSCLKYRPVRLVGDKFLPVLFYTEAGLGEQTISRRGALREYFW
jgi:CRISPR type III-B/RAMP module RAMP protein Cmr1